ncbi:MAG: hypothetical protein HQK84_03045, partial [Nitrospinae bacterium]|nr:hypothetical protein [Nitrospinota bacterium]
GEKNYSLKPEKSIQRIAFLGDSTTFGDEVNDNETVPFYLEGQMKKSEVLNFGVHSYGLGQMYLRLKDEGFSYSPNHVVVMLLIPWDIYRDIKSYSAHNKPVFSIKNEELQIKNIPVPLKYQRSWLHGNSYLYAWLYGLLSNQRQTGKVGETVQLSKLIIKEIQKECKARKIPFTLVTIIAAASVNSDEKQREVIRFINNAYREMNIDLLDLSGDLAAFFSKRGRAVVAEKGHWSAEGNSFIAGKIREHLSPQSSP